MPLPIDPTSYDPRQYGARCDLCVLRELRLGYPVPPEIHTPNGRIALVGELPGETETELLRPFVGPSGWVLQRGLESVGLSRTDVDIYNAGACRPPGNNYRAVLNFLKKVNEERIACHQEPLPTPVECCRPQLEGWLRDYTCIVTAGNVALHSLLPTVRVGIMSVRGTMYSTDEFGQHALLLPVQHPAHVARAMRWDWVFKGDLARARRYFDGQLTWAEPSAIYLPSMHQIRTYFARIRARGLKMFYDLETDALEPLDARIRCVGVGTEQGGMVVPLLSRDGHTRFYADHDLREIIQILRGFFTDPNVLKLGHNIGSYDRMCCERRLKVTPTPIIDTLVLHRLGRWSELPHTLAFLGSTLTDVHAWKAGKIATNARTDMELWKYNLLDVVVNARVLAPVVEQVRSAGQVGLVRMDHDIQDMCCGMHKVGLQVDQGVDDRGNLRPVPMQYDKAGHPVRDEDTGAHLPDLTVFGRGHWEVKLVKEAAEAVEECRKIVGDARFDVGQDAADFLLDDEEPDAGQDEALMEAAEFNPNSADQLRNLLFTKLKLPIPLLSNGKMGVTSSGEPSTGDEVLRALMTDPKTPEEARRIIRSARVVRKRRKYLGYVRGARNAPGEKGCHLHKDGALHPHWNSTGKGSGDEGSTTSSRLTSSPNLQNWPEPLRSMIMALLGMCFVAADGDQIELRYIAALARCMFYLEVFQRACELPPNHPEGDPHRRTMIAVFGQTAVDTASGQPYCSGGKWNNKGSGTYKKMRDLAKRVQYASQYGAEPSTVHRVITSAENAKGQLLYPDLTVRQVKLYWQRWRKNVPEIVGWWETVMRDYARQGYVEEVVTGRRRFFMDGAQPKKSGIDSHLINFPVQAGTAGLINRASIRVNQLFPYGFAGARTGVCGQFHDALMLQVPERDAAEVAEALQAAMTQTHPALPGMTFTSAAKIGKRWIDV